MTEKVQPIVFAFALGAALFVPAVAHADSTPNAGEREPARERVPQWLVLGAGLGYGAASDDDQASASGLYAEAEYVFALESWIGLRPYAGLVLTSPDENSCSGGVRPCDVSAKIGIAGGKLRFTVPIPYVSPFVEFGAGLSAGAIESQYAGRRNSFDGITYHVPVGLGLSIGGDTKVDMALQYLIHPYQHEIAGALAISVALRMQ